MAERQDSPVPITDADAAGAFKRVGTRIKQLYKAEPLHYVVQLQSSPADFLRQYPKIARAVYSRDALPCVCPLDPRAVANVESMIACRGNGHSTPMENQMMALMAGGLRQQLHGVMPHQLPGVMPHPHQGGQLMLYPPGTIGGTAPGASPGASNLRRLMDEDVRMRAQANVESTVADRPADLRPPALAPDPRPPSLALMDGEATAARECEAASQREKPVVGAAVSSAQRLREVIAGARAGLARDRAVASEERRKNEEGRRKKEEGRGKKEKGRRKTAANVTTGMSSSGAKRRPAGRVLNARPASRVTPPRYVKPASWLKAWPNGCPKCRYVAGCTKSCYKARGTTPPK